jgi:NAD-dependent deacetylase
MRPGVVWFGEMLDHRRVDYVESFIEGECDTVVVVGTTAAFGYIVDWACRAAAGGGHLIEINPEPTPLSELAHEVIRAPSASALPQLLERFA